MEAERTKEPLASTSARADSFIRGSNTYRWADVPEILSASFYVSGAGAGAVVWGGGSAWWLIACCVRTKSWYQHDTARLAWTPCVWSVQERIYRMSVVFRIPQTQRLKPLSTCVCALAPLLLPSLPGNISASSAQHEMYAMRNQKYQYSCCQGSRTNHCDGFCL